MNSGISYGSLLGMTYAALYPDSIERMVLDGTGQAALLFPIILLLHADMVRLQETLIRPLLLVKSLPQKHLQTVKPFCSFSSKPASRPVNLVVLSGLTDLMQFLKLTA